MRKYTFALGIALLFVGFIGAKVSADPGGRTQLHGYFTNETSSNHNPASSCGGSGWSDVLCGGIQPITGAVGGPYTVPSKQQLINFIEGKLSDGNSNAVGAAFIISTMSGLNGPGYGRSVSAGEQSAWEALVNQSSVTLGIVKNYSYSWNAAYASDINDDLYYPDSGDSGDSLIFYEDGTPVYALQIICANPVGGLGGLTKDPVGKISSVTLECDGTYTVVATFKDPDYSPTEGFLGNSVNDKLRGNQSSPSYTWKGITSADATGYWPMELWVHDYDSGGTAHGYTMVDSFAKSDVTQATGCGNPTPPTSICPGDPAIATNADVTVALPDLSPRDSTHGTSLPTVSSPDGSTSASGSAGSRATYFIVSETATVPTAVTDYSAQTLGGSAVALQLGGGDKLNQATQTKGKTSVNYKPFTTAYPYDANQAEVTYYSVYSQTKYVSSSSASYLCNSGDTSNGSGKCTHTYSATASCSSGTLTASGCEHTSAAKRTAHYSCPPPGYPNYTDMRQRADGSYYCHWDGHSGNVSPRVTYTYTCTSGTLSGTNCITYTTPTYTCNSGDTRSGTTCSHIYNATVYYVWQKGATTTGLKSSSGTAYPAAMTACYPRNFTVTSVSAAKPSYSRENPSSGSASATAHVHFSVSHGGSLRESYSVNGLNYIATFSGTGGLTCSGSASGSFEVATTSTDPGGYDTSPDPTVGSATCSAAQPAPLGGRVCANFTVRPTGDYVNANGVITDASGNPMPSGNGGLISGSNCGDPVINEPYLKVFGGDVAAGIGFTNGSSCTSSSTATIATFNTGSNPYGGSGTGLAAVSVKPVATGTDEGFASAQEGGVTGSAYLPSGGAVGGPATTLSFGNSDGSKFGGNYGSSTTNCSPDYAGGTPTASADNSISGSQNLATLASKAYVAIGPISLSGTLSAGQHIVIYSNYNVTITGDTVFTNPGTDVTDMPSFSLIVKGANININPNVVNLAGNYIAQDGTIDDCNTAGSIYPTCNTKLTVNGSFVATNIKFYRMGEYGSLRYSTTDSGPGSNNASEEFDYSPATWLAQPPDSGTPPAYDAVTSLPPVL